MRKEIIEQMEGYLNGGRFQSYDFDLDKCDLKDRNEPFIWAVLENGTSLQFLGRTFEKRLEEESFRMRIFKNKISPLDNFIYWSKDSKCKIFYYDYLDLREIQKEDIEKLYLNIWNERIEQLKKEYKEEAEVANKPIEIVCKYDCEEHLKEQLIYAKSLKDESLKKVLDMLRNHIRMAVDHEIYLLKDGERDFYFEEKVNGKVRLNGGIIFHANESDNRWKSHT